MSCEKRFKVIPWMHETSAYLLTVDQVAEAVGVTRDRARNALNSAAWRGTVIRTVRNGVSYFTHASSTHTTDVYDV